MVKLLVSLTVNVNPLSHLPPHLKNPSISILHLSAPLHLTPLSTNPPYTHPMADSKDTKKMDNKEKTTKNTLQEQLVQLQQPLTKSLSRSLTMRSSSNLTKDSRSSSLKKPYLYHPVNSLDRSTSVKKLYNSPADGKKPTKDDEKDQLSIHSKVSELCKLFGSQKLSSKSDLNESDRNLSSIRLPGSEGKIVVYFTSLRGVRRTYEDCYAVRLIFRGLRVVVDERDVSMDSGYRRELQRVMRDRSVSLPQVFVKGRLLGGAEVVKEMFETGELAKMVEGMPVKAAGYVCEGCGDVRFVPCLHCDGSKKVFDEEEEVAKRCRVCNENGLIKCPTCCS